MKPIILDLCGGTGAWSKPWAESGEYDVRVITLPEHDVRTYQPPEEVYGILAAPPCTYFSHMRRRWGKPTREQMTEALSVVEACMRIIWKCQPEFWALENPAMGDLKKWIGLPKLEFQPFEYGDAWTKRTAIWGNFISPMKFNQVKPHRQSHYLNPAINAGSGRTLKERQSMTPPGFARAFFEANRIRDMKKQEGGHERKMQ
jgi:hypothetical protein